ncbi:MAG: YCF48-related protein, partial [Pseudomonadota bacterium]
MTPARILTCLFIAVIGTMPLAQADEGDRDFFDGIEARNVGPFRGGRATVAVGVRQNPHVYYMGSTGGVWKTENAGASWQAVSDDDFGTAAVGAIAVAPSDPNVLFVGMGESPFRNIASSQGDGVYKSTDAGKSWTRVGFEDLKQTGEIRIHPTDPDTIWVAAQGNAYAETDTGGIYKSTDGGTSWRRVLAPLNETTGAVDLALDMSNPRILYAALWDNHRDPWALRSGGPGSSIWRSTDGGESWERLTEDLPDGMGKIGVAASPARPGRVWAIVEAEGEKGGLYRSDDRGDSWSQVNSERVLIARAWYYMHIFADPNDENTVYVLNSPFMKSIDGGKTFARVETPHVDNHYLWINPDNSQWMINANDGGANVSVDGGATWSRQNNQPTAQFYRVNTDNAFEYRIYGGQQDNSSVAIKSRSRDGAIGRDDWEVHGGCESAYVAMDPNNPRYTYGGCLFGLIDEFDTETRTVRSIMAYDEIGLGAAARDLKYRYNWNAPIHVSLHDPDVIYHGSNVLLKSDDRGFNWTEASPDLTRDEDDKQGPGGGPYTNENIEQYNTIFAIAESPHDADTLWVGTDDGLLHVTQDGGASWQDVTPSGVDRGLINSIEVSPHDPATAYVVAMKYKDGDNRP